MPENFHSSDAPPIRLARNGEEPQTIGRRAQNSRTITIDSDDLDRDDTTFRAESEPGTSRRPRGARPMPTRLSQERAENERLEMERAEIERLESERYESERIENERASRIKETTKSSRSKRAAQKAEAEREQIALNLKQPRKKQDSTVKKRQVLGTVLFVFAILVTIAIVSYTPNDAAVAETKFSEIFSVITRVDPLVNAHADVAQNRLGLIGAILADFLINKTIGYASIIYPIFFGWWALAFFRFTARQRQRLTLATTFFLVTAILFSATIGTTQLISALPHIPREWSGAVGQFLGLTFTRLIGSVGALIVYATAFLITLVFSIDLDIEKTFLRIAAVYQKLLMGSRRRLIEFWDKREAKREAKELAREAAALEEVESEEEVSESVQPLATAPDITTRKKNVRETEPMTATAQNKQSKLASKEIQGAVATEVGVASDEIASKGQEAAKQSDAEAPTSAPDPVRILRSNDALRATGVAGAAFGASIPADQPLLKVRPVSKVLDANGNIPRITKPATDRLGHTGNIKRLSNGAVESGPVTENEAPQAAEPSTIVDASPSAKEEARTMTKLERAMNDRPNSSKLGAVPSEVQAEAPRSIEAKKDTKIEIRKDPVPVQLGDESTLSNDVLPHSVMGADELAAPSSLRETARDAVRDAQSLSQRAGKEAPLFDAPKHSVIPENPYLEVLNKYRNPSLELLTAADPKDNLEADDEELAMKGRLLRDKLATFGVDIENITVTPGPVVTLYEFTPAEGVKVSRVENLTDDIALAMKARGIRIIAPIPGRGTIGVEIPNDDPKMVVIRSLLESDSFRKTKMNLPLALGKTISGDVYVDDLNKMPHLLIAGATGAGKSVGVNGIIASLLYAKSPRDVKFVIVDPKKIELSLYKKLRKHYLIVSPEAGEDIVTTPAFAVVALKAVELEMERRYDKLAKAAVRSLVDYNIKVAQGKLQSTQDEQHYHLPYIVVIIDELADLMITAGREIEEPICRIAQMARAVGIHLILATQRPSVDVITGVIKANFPARIAYQVATRVDSRTILDSMGAEQLLGNGDMLYQPSGTPKPIRLQSPFISTEEVEAIVDAVEMQDGPGLSYTRPWTLPSLKNKPGSTSASNDEDQRDELFEEAARVIVRHQQGSVSVLQRRLKVGYSRAARIVDELEIAGIVSAFDGAKARQVLVENEAELEVILESLR